MDNWLELTITLATFLILVTYHVYLFIKTRSAPLTTAIGITNHVRRNWVQNIMQNGRDILAVQTLRNQVMAATFLASTAILISLGLLGVAFRPSVFEEISHVLNITGTKNETLWMIKLLVLAVLFFSAFFNFTLSIRYYNHAGMMINIPEAHDPNATPEKVSEVLNHGALHYTLGMRGYYLAVPAALWLFGPLWMLFGTILLVAVLYRLDREA
jgi:uncharacterized membrane protein